MHSNISHIPTMKNEKNEKKERFLEFSWKFRLFITVALRILSDNHIRQTFGSLHYKSRNRTNVTTKGNIIFGFFSILGNLRRLRTVSPSHNTPSSEDPKKGNESNSNYFQIWRKTTVYVKMRKI